MSEKNNEKKKYEKKKYEKKVKYQEIYLKKKVKQNNVSGIK